MQALLFVQSASTTPRATLQVLMTVDSLLQIPVEPGAPLPLTSAFIDYRLLGKIAANEKAMENLLRFASTNVSTDPQSDLEWVAIKARDLLGPFLEPPGSRKGWDLAAFLSGEPYR